MTETTTEKRPTRRTGGRKTAASTAGASTNGQVKSLPGSPYGRIVRKEIQFAGRPLIVETGKAPGRAHGSGPVGAVRMGFVDGKLVVNPTEEQRDQSDLDLVIAATADAVMMVEAGAEQISEELALDAIRQAHEEIRKLCKLQDELRREVGKE